MKGGESESDISDSEHFLTKGAFLLTPSHGLSMEKASAICEKMEFKGEYYTSSYWVVTQDFVLKAWVVTKNASVTITIILYTLQLN